jgi:hypothetical protein
MSTTQTLVVRDNQNVVLAMRIVVAKQSDAHRADTMELAVNVSVFQLACLVHLSTGE